MPLRHCAAFGSLRQGIMQVVFHLVFFVVRCPCFDSRSLMKMSAKRFNLMLFLYSSQCRRVDIELKVASFDVEKRNLILTSLLLCLHVIRQSMIQFSISPAFLVSRSTRIEDFHNCLRFPLFPRNNCSIRVRPFGLRLGYGKKPQSSNSWLSWSKHSLFLTST
jgi:hypothetical protein